MPGLVRASRLPVWPGTLEEKIIDERLERIVRALWSCLGSIALIALLGSPPVATDATTPADPPPGSLSVPGEHRTVDETRVGDESGTDVFQIQADGVPREFYFSRVAYNSYRGFGRRGGSWRTDYPKADRIFLSFIDRLLPNLDAYEGEFVVQLPEPDMRRFPFLYALEVGRMALSPPEVEGLRSYLLAGGFLVIDDFWGTREWQHFEQQIRQVLPEFEIVDLTLDHPIFTTFYEIDEILQVPNVDNGIYGGGRTHEQDGYVPMVRGIHDDKGRLMVIINWNTDLGDAWEWADNPYYPLRYSTYAYEMGVNFIVYAMSH